MSTYKSRGPATRDYLVALGQASYAFSSLEWNLVCVARRIDPSFITPDFYRRWTSGIVYERFVALVKNNGQTLGPLEQRLTDLADRFDQLVKKRNSIVHSQPITGVDGSAMLARYQFVDSFHWTVENLDSFTEEAENLSSEFNAILHHDLS